MTKADVQIVLMIGKREQLRRAQGRLFYWIFSGIDVDQCARAKNIDFSIRHTFGLGFVLYGHHSEWVSLFSL
jgi:hypothetical protein